MFDPSEIVFGGVTLIILVFGLVQFFKELFGIEGKAVTALAMAMGLIVFGIPEALAFLPEQFAPYAEAVYRSLTAGLAAAGFYKFGTRNSSA